MGVTCQAHPQLPVTCSWTNWEGLYMVPQVMVEKLVGPSIGARLEG